MELFMKKLVFTFVLVMVSGWVFAADAPATGKVASAAEANSVRKPTGDINKFWDAIAWDKLSAEEQKFWAILGWNAKNWHGDKAQAPASENTDWDKLSKAEQTAATALGYDKKSWDAE
jgi:hypothetical protein